MSHRLGSPFTMSPTISTLPANEFAGDFQAFFFAGPSTATGRPRRVMVIGSATLLDLVEDGETLCLELSCTHHSAIILQ